MKRTRIAVVLGATLALAIPAAAQAALPKTSSTLIVPAKSIGGLALGATATGVTNAWGKNKACEYQCLYEGRKGTAETAALASAGLETPSHGAPKVWSLSISVGSKQVGSNLVPNFNTPLTSFKTAKGIGLGSTATELKHAYHAAKKQGEPGGFYYTLQGPKDSFTFFSAPKGRITQIGVLSHPGG